MNWTQKRPIRRSLEPAPQAQWRPRAPGILEAARKLGRKCCGVGGLVFSLFFAHAAPEIGPWLPLFQGVDHLVATNFSQDDDFVNLSVANALRIDLQDPDIRLLSTPRITNYVTNSRETAGRTVSQFLVTNRVQVAINAGFFSPGTYYLPEGTPMTASGLLISQGELVSPANSTYSASLIVSASNHASIIPTNWPAAPTDGVWTAISGDYPVLVNGVNVGRLYRNRGGIHGIHPRTAIGLSEDRRYLFLLAIDGRQPGYSDGAYDQETAAYLLLLGASDGINMDGGGSTTMVVEDSLGGPKRLNRSSAVADSGRERTVGCHLGIYAKWLTGFIDNLAVKPDDDAATVTWTTPNPATTRVEYGTTPDLGLSTPFDTPATMRHALRLTELTPGTDYYFQAVSEADGLAYTSPLRRFTTANYLTTNAVIALNHSWKHSFENLDGVNWTDPDYDDSTWDGPSEGVLWADTTFPPNPDVPFKGAQLSAQGEFPYVTYYFRAHFDSALSGAGAQLLFTGYIDDGAVIYLNGQEIYRLRMDEAPLPILNSSLAVSFPCEGSATCPDEFIVGGDVGEHLRAGDNVLAVEVHNYVERSPDITFGLAVTEARSIPVPAALSIADAQGSRVLSWERGGFVLQWAETSDGPWTDVPGPVLASPFTAPDLGPSRYYRLRK